MKRWIGLLILLLTSCRAPDRVPTSTDAPIRNAEQRGVAFLLKQQQADGSFRTGIDRSFMKDYFHLGVTVFGSLALMSAEGDNPAAATDRTVHGAVAGGVRFVLDNMNADGYIARGETNKRAPYFEHAMGMLLLGEYLIRYPDRDPSFAATVRKGLERGVAWTLNAQRDVGGWPYRDGHRTIEAIGAALQLDGLRSARDAGLRVPPEVFKNGVALIKGQAEAGGAFRCKTVDQAGHTTYAGTTYPVAILNALGESGSPEAADGVKYLRDSRGGVDALLKWLPEDPEKPAWMKYKDGLQLEGIFYALLAFRRTPKEEWQSGWFRKIREHLASTQSSDGSWPGLYGPAYGTAVSLLMLHLERSDLHWFNGAR